MREPEFLPGWYVRQLRRAEGRALQRRVWLAAVGSCLCMSAAVAALAGGIERAAPAGAPGAVVGPPGPARAAPSSAPAFASCARSALNELERMVPADVALSDVIVRRGGAAAVVTVEIRGSAARPSALDELVNAVARNPAFSRPGLELDRPAEIPAVAAPFRFTVEFTPRPSPPR